MYAFADCSALQSATLGEGLTELGFGAFQNCSALENVQLPHSLTTIDSMVFAGCTSLTQLTLPLEITNIAPDAIESSTILWVEEDAPILDILKEAKLNYKVIPNSA